MTKVQMSRSPASLVEKLRGERIRHVMSPDPLLVKPTTTVGDAIRRMRDESSSSVLVCIDGQLQGIFTERDYLDRIAGSAELLDEPIEEHMSLHPTALTPDDSLGDLIPIIVDGGYRHLPVVEKGKVCGIVAALDIVKYIADLFPAEVYNLPPDPNQVMPSIEGA